MADLDLTQFMKDGSGSGPADLDWLDVDEQDYREMDSLPKQNLDVVPDLKALWRHQDEPASMFVPNQDLPKTMGDLGALPMRVAPEVIIRTARLAIMRSTAPQAIFSALRQRFDLDSLKEARAALGSVLAERGLLGGYYIDATDFPKCAQGGPAAHFVQRYAKDAKFVKAKTACGECQHKQVLADESERCGVFHKQVVLDVPYTEELAEAVEDSQRAKGRQVAAAHPMQIEQWWEGRDKAFQEAVAAKLHLSTTNNSRWNDTEFRRVAKFYERGGQDRVATQERIKKAFLAPQDGAQPTFTGRTQSKPKVARVSLEAVQKAQQEQKTAQHIEQAKVVARQARPIVATLRKEMLKGRGRSEVIRAIKLAFDPRDLEATKEAWLPLLRQAGLYGAVYIDQPSFDDCRIGADFLAKHSSKVKAVVKGEKCGSCIFNKVARCMMYGRKLVKTAGEVLSYETVAAVLDEERIAGNLPVGAEKMEWGKTPAEALREIHAAARTPKGATTGGVRGIIEQAFRGGGNRRQATGDLTKRAIIKSARMHMNDGLYGQDLLHLLRGQFETRDLVAARNELRAALSEQGLQGIKFIDPTVYDDYGQGCKTAASKHRSRAAVKFAKVGDKCASCVYQTQPGRCSVLNKELVREPEYVDKAAEQKAILASGPSTQVEYGDLVNNGMSMITEFQLQQSGSIDLNPAGDDPQVSVEFGSQEVDL